MADKDGKSVFLPVISSIQKIRIYETKSVSKQLFHLKSKTFANNKNYFCNFKFKQFINSFVILDNLSDWIQQQRKPLSDPSNRSLNQLRDLRRSQ